MASNNEGGDIINNDLDELQNEILNLEENELGDENEEPNQYDDDESPIVDFQIDDDAEEQEGDEELLNNGPAIEFIDENNVRFCFSQISISHIH